MATFIRGNYSFGLRMQNSSQGLLLLNKIIERYGLLSSDTIITNNSTVRHDILERLGKGRNIDVQVVYNNIPPMTIREKQDTLQTRDKYGIPRNAKVMVTAGILNQGKNIEAIIRCLPKIEGKNIYSLVVGGGSTEADFYYRDSLRRLAKEMGVGERVIFTGWVEKEELWKIYRASDLFVLPSLSEGMPNAMLEALGTGLPCMGSDVPGIRDILHDRELLFDPRDETALTVRVKRFFRESPFFDKVKSLCQEKKKMFEFDWKDRIFRLATKGTSATDESVLI